MGRKWHEHSNLILDGFWQVMNVVRNRNIARVFGSARGTGVRAVTDLLYWMSAYRSLWKLEAPVLDYFPQRFGPFGTFFRGSNRYGFLGKVALVKSKFPGENCGWYRVTSLLTPTYFGPFPIFNREATLHLRWKPIAGIGTFRPNTYCLRS